jgi:DNA recombination protein RmuC
MELNTGLLILVGGAAIGALTTYFLLRSKLGHGLEASKTELAQLSTQLSSLLTEKTRAEARSSILETSLDNSDQELSIERTKLLEISSSLAIVQTELKNANIKLQDQKQEVQELQARFSAEFKNLANDILEEKSKRFTELNKDNLTAVLSPLQEKIKDFQTTIADTYGKDSKERATLAEQIRSLTDLNQQITKEASNLTTALRGQSKTQGDWGEMILEEILDRSGLVKGVHYAVQQQLTSEEGKTQRPDVIVNLPDGKHLVIDSKVSLLAYTEYCKAEHPDSQREWLSEHISSIKKHIKELSEKKYQNLYQLQSLDFILMFIPLEPAFAVAVKSDIGLYNEAFERNIVIVTTSTLIATLRTIGSIWRQENQSRNSIEIARKSGELYDKFVGFLEDLKLIGDRLTASQKAYDDAMGKLTSGRGNLIRRAEELKTMGAKASKSLPSNLNDKSLEPGQSPEAGQSIDE